MNKDIVIPSLGALESSKVVEVLVKKGQVVTQDEPLLTLESDKASMDFPSPFAGTVDTIDVKEGDEVSEGDVVFSFKDVVSEEALQQDEVKQDVVQEDKKPTDKTIKTKGKGFYASPFVRRMAVELEIDLSEITPSGNGGRITIDDMRSFLLRSKPKSIDHAKWGSVEFEGLKKIQAISSKVITESWQVVPQVTQHHVVDITDLEALRVSTGKKVTMIVFVMKALVETMKKHPVFCRAWVDDKTYARRDYFNVGFAVDTPYGLMVPVCKDVDKKGLLELGDSIKELSEKARENQLKREDLEGRVTTISSLGGIGGGHFTPIVTLPDSFMLGLARSFYQPVYQEDGLEKRYMLPISLSYDHRLIDGADAARFLVGLEEALGTMLDRVDL